MSAPTSAVRRVVTDSGRVRYLPRPRLFGGRLTQLRYRAAIARLESGLDVHVIPHPVAGSGKVMVRIAETAATAAARGAGVVTTYVRVETYWSAFALFQDIAHRRALPAYVRTSSDSSSIERGQE